MFVSNVIKTCENYWGLWWDIYSNLHTPSYGTEKWNLLKVRNFAELFLIDNLQMQLWANTL